MVKLYMAAIQRRPAFESPLGSPFARLTGGYQMELTYDRLRSFLTLVQIIMGIESKSIAYENEALRRINGEPGSNT